MVDNHGEIFWVTISSFAQRSDAIPTSPNTVNGQQSMSQMKLQNNCRGYVNDKNTSAF